MPNKLWEGEERREHDNACESKWQERKMDIKEWVCLTSKPTRLKQGIMWAALGSALSLSITIAGYSYVKAGDQKVIDTKQTAAIEHITEDHGELVTDVEDMKEDVETIQSDVGDIKVYMGQQTQILKALAHEHGIEVDIE